MPTPMSRVTAATRPCSLAAFAGHKNTVKLLLANNSNAVDDKGETPLYVVALTFHKDIAELLHQHDGTSR